MTVVSFDSSALATLPVGEEGSDLAADLEDGCDIDIAARTLGFRTAPAQLS